MSLTIQTKYSLEYKLCPSYLFLHLQKAYTNHKANH